MRMEKAVEMMKRMGKDEGGDDGGWRVMAVKGDEGVKK